MVKLPDEVEISIHALREEGDLGHGPKSAMLIKFLSTPSARRATGVSVGYRIDTIISIHALREEGDWPLRGRNSASTHFYPRPPRGGRRPERRCAIAGWPISIHALREEGDVDDKPLR